MELVVGFAKKDTKVVSKIEGPKIFLAAPFFEVFFSAASCKKGLKNGAARKLLGPSYFVTTLDRCHEF